jgi:molybdopterin synthase catalytic subunit
MVIIDVAISDGPIKANDELFRFMSNSDSSAGAVVSFCGVTRSDQIIKHENDGKAVLTGHVTSLIYEAYVPMAESIMKSISNEANKKSGDCLRRIVIRHSVGTVAVGESSFLVIASSPHRSEAIAAVRLIVDDVKANVPIWKRDVLDSSSLGPWRANCECTWGHSHSVQHSPVAYRIVTQNEWEQSLQCGVYRGSSLDMKDGYMHLSAPGSVKETALKYFANSTETLLLLEVILPIQGEDCYSKEGVTLQWDWVESRKTEFPHLYPSLLPIAAVRAVHFLKSKDSAFFFGGVV